MLSIKAIGYILDHKPENIVINKVVKKENMR